MTTQTKLSLGIAIALTLAVITAIGIVMAFREAEPTGLFSVVRVGLGERNVISQGLTRDDCIQAASVDHNPNPNLLTICVPETR